MNFFLIFETHTIARGNESFLEIEDELFNLFELLPRNVRTRVEHERSDGRRLGVRTERFQIDSKNGKSFKFS